MIYPDDYINKVICGDSLEVMKGIPDNSVDLVLTDPPYGYSFMGKDWDKAVPSVETWKECLRILKPGAFCFVMSAPRQDVLSRMMVNLEDAGFRTDFTSIYWTYASGFPKAANVGKKIDKQLGVKGEVVGKKKIVDVQSNGSVGDLYQRVDKLPMKEVEITTRVSDDGKKFDGAYSGFQPKPAVEVVIVCMKPLNKKTFLGQALDNGKGVTWLDDCRVPYVDDNDKEKARFGSQTDIKGNNYNTNSPSKGNIYAKDVLSSEIGRFPANILVSNDVLNDKVSYESQGGDIIKIDNGFDSRYFSLDAWDKQAQNTYPFLIVPKASKAEKNKGCDSLDSKFTRTMNDGIGGREHNEDQSSAYNKNNHPTVKPLKLMRYLITMATRENDVVLDPFNGSGTTCLAGIQLNRQYIGIELSTEYVTIARKRLSAELDIKQHRLL